MGEEIVEIKEEIKPRRPARLEDIAQTVGISRSEVSRVLNGRVRSGRGVSQVKQDEIRRVASELGYQPHQAARNLARGRTDTVGIPIQTTWHELLPHYQEIISALTRILGENGLNLLLLPWQDDRLGTLENAARARICDGIILTDMEIDDPRPHAMAAHGQTFVIRGTAPAPGMAAVGMDNVAIGRMAIEHLAGLGHRRILFHNIGYHLLSGRGRRQGFLEEAERRGIADAVLYNDDFRSEADWADYARSVFSGPNRPSAVYAGDELAAISFLRALSDLGLRVPEDVSVMASINSRLLPRVYPHLTHVRVRQDEVAIEVAKLMVRKLAGEAVPETQTFMAPLLHIKGSTAPPRA